MGRPRNTRPKQPSRPASVTSDEDDLHDESGRIPSPISSALQPTSQSGSSSIPGDFGYHPYHLPYPHETQDVYPYESASRQDHRERPQVSRENSSRKERDRGKEKRVPSRRAPAHRKRSPSPETSSESGESSAGEFIDSPDYGGGMTRPQSHYHPDGYTQSSSSGSWGNYPQVPPSGQLMHYQHPQQHPQQAHPHYPYPHMAGPPPAGYPPQGYQHDPRMRHEPNGHGGPPSYRPPGYGQAMAPHYGAQDYYSSHYPPPHQYPHQYHPGMQNPYLPPFMANWQVASHSRRTSPPNEKKELVKAASPPPPLPVAPAPPAVSQDDIIQKMQELLSQANEQREAKEKERQLAIQSADDKVKAIQEANRQRQEEEKRIRDDAMRQAKEQAEAAAKAEAARQAEAQRIREEAIRAAQKAIADKAAADAEQAAREARIREEAARMALEKAAADAKAKAEQEAKEKKIAADAAAEAKSAAEKKAAEDAAASEAAAKTAKEEAEKKVKEAEDAAAKAKTEAETAQAAAAAAKPPDKKPPVRFKDAIGRNYNFPWERCNKWRDMENLIVQAFQHIEDLGEHVIQGRYDLIGPDKEIIMPQYWDYIVQPDMHITMMLWPLPEPKPAPPPPLTEPEIITALPPGVDILDDIINGGGEPIRGSRKPRDKGKSPLGSSFATWMLGAPRPTRKAPKKIPKKAADILGPLPPL